MERELQQKIIDNPKLYLHLKQNSAWIKQLNRDPRSIKQFEEAMKDLYKEHATDKMNEVLDNIDLISSFLNAMK